MATISMINMHLVPNNCNPSLFTFHKKASILSCSISSHGDATRPAEPFTLQHSNAQPHRDIIRRRSGNYKPPLWGFDYIQSLNSEYKEERHVIRASELKEKVKKLLDDDGEMENSVEQLELIDNLQRLGISYHFEEQIMRILNRMYVKRNEPHENKRDLYSTALEFRLLRQHGFHVSQDVFESFKNEKGEFKTTLGEDTKGLLQLYEASFMSMEGEMALDEAREFSTIFLQENRGKIIDENLSLMVNKALELPLNWRVERPNARWFINAYERKPDMNPTVLELAKLDFNIVQAKHQQQLKHVSKWWKTTCLAETLPFARDRLVEKYFWNIGVLPEPQNGYSLRMATKVNALITIIDDIFDVYGTLEELQLFNNVIQRWDIEAIEQLPKYMQTCYLALNNFINEMAYDVLKEQGVLVIPYLRKSWADLCNTYLREAKWYSKGYTPRMDEYIENAWISISAPVILSHTYFLVTNPIKKEAIQSLSKYHDIIPCSGMLLRLANDLGTSPEEIKRGDVPKSIQCYMNETGACQEEAEAYVRFLIGETWKKMNKERTADTPFSQTFIKAAANLGRMAQYMYQHGDGHGNQNAQIFDRISSLLFEPIIV